MNEEKMRKEFEYWYRSPANTDLTSKLAYLSWKAACAIKQEEIDALLTANALAYKSSEQESLDRIAELETKLREQHQNQLDLMESMKETASAKASFLASILKAGEHYAGIILGKDGEPDHHLILLPGEAESVNWAQTKEFAAKAGGELPTRREQSLLFTNLKEQFQPRWYWSGEQHASDSDYAWGQNFLDGYQSRSHKTSNYRARAVRRVPI